MSITYELPAFPQLNQLHDVTSDGRPEENASWDCVPTSIAAGLTYLTGKSFNGDELHDAVYQEGTLGGEDAAHYVAYCAQQGVTLAPFNGTPAQLVTEIHTEVSDGHPVVLTMPSQWGTPAAQLPANHTTHVGIAYGIGLGMIRVMNPWIAPTPHDGTDAYWAARLEYNQVWVMRATNAAPAATEGSTPVPTVLDISNATVAQFFYLTSAGKWHCKTTTQEIGGGLLDFYKSVAGVGGLNGLTLLGLPLTGEIGQSGKPGVVVQIFERGALAYDLNHTLDNPPGSGAVYLVHINQGTVLDFLTSGVQQQLATATAALTAAQAQVTQAQQQLASAQSQANEQVGAAKTATAAAQQALAAAQAQASQDATAAAAQLTTAQEAQAAAEAAATQAQSDLEAARAQLAQQQQQVAQQVADAAKGLAIVTAIKAVWV